MLEASQGFPGGSVVKNSPANAGDKGLIPGREDPLVLCSRSQLGCLLEISQPYP